MSTLDVHALVFAKPRRGISTPALLVIVSITVLMAVAALDLAQLSHQRHQIQIGADAAVLAATPLLMDRCPLYLGPEGSTPDESDLAAVRFAQIEAAQQQAIYYAGLNTVANRPIILDENPTNALNGDVVVGFVADPSAREFDGQPGPDGSLNSLAVRASRRKAAGELPLLWMARQVGLENLEMKVYSQAAVDQRICGFRPLSHVSVPVLPVAVLPTLDDLMMFPDSDLAQLWWSQGPHDNYIVDPITQTVDGGADGIAEMVIRVNSDAGGSPSSSVKTRQGVLVGLDVSGDLSPDAILHFSQFGLMADDLNGGQLSIDDANFPPNFPAKYNVESEDLSGICHRILAADPPLVGAPRILPIGAHLGDGSSIGIVGFVAGTIVHCEPDPGDDSLLLVVQPCLLQSPTALVGGDNPRNPWIGKLLLNR